jgi:hypothetical protein
MAATIKFMVIIAEWPSLGGELAIASAVSSAEERV